MNKEENQINTETEMQVDKRDIVSASCMFVVRALGNYLLKKSFDSILNMVIGSEKEKPMSFEDLSADFQLMSTLLLNKTAIQNASASSRKVQTYLAEWNKTKSSATLQKAYDASVEALSYLEETGVSGVGPYTAALIVFLYILGERIKQASNTVKAANLREFRKEVVQKKAALINTLHQQLVDLRLAKVSQVLTSIELVESDSWSYREFYYFTDIGATTKENKRKDYKNTKNTPEQNRREAENGRSSYISTLPSQFDYLSDVATQISSAGPFLEDGDIVELTLSVNEKFYLTASDLAGEATLYNARFQANPDKELRQFTIKKYGDTTIALVLNSKTFGAIHLEACNYIDKSIYYDARFQCRAGKCAPFNQFQFKMYDDKTVSLFLTTSYGDVYLAGRDYTSSYDARFYCLNGQCTLLHKLKINIVKAADGSA